VDIIFRNPYLTVSRVERRLALTNQGARNLIKDAERRGWLADLGPRGRGGRNYWYARDVFEVIEAPFEYDHRPSDEEEVGTRSAELDEGPTDRR
jgi:hypothetical protein